jgi:hypothetical protein
VSFPRPFDLAQRAFFVLVNDRRKRCWGAIYMRDDIAARRKKLREAVAKLRNIALNRLERRGYDVRGKTPSQIRLMLKRPPTKRKSNLKMAD